MLLLNASIAPLVRHLVTALRRRRADQRGQASAEYALVLLGAAAVAGLLTTWVTHSNVVGKLLDTVFHHLLAQAR